MSRPISPPSAFAPPLDASAAPAPDSPGNRARDSLFLLARIRADGLPEPIAVKVRNLSEGGLMAELAIKLAPDAAVEVEVRGIGWVAGRIAWYTAGRAGIAFDVPIDPRQARRPVGSARRAQLYGVPPGR